MAKGLEASNYRGWIDDDISIDEFTKKLFSEFVIGTPAFDTSKKGRDFYSYFQYKELAEYLSLKNDLVGSVLFNTYEKYDELEAGILGDADVSFTDNLPEILTEKIYIFSGEVSKNQFVKNYFKSDPNRQKDKQVTACKKCAAELDKLFAHIRNSLAHGRFVVAHNNGEKFYILQDEHQNQISARMILKASTLQSWIDYLDVRREKIEHPDKEDIVVNENKIAS